MAYRRIGVQTPNPTLSDVNTDLERTKQRLRWIQLLLLLLLLLLCAAILGYLAWCIVLTTNSNGQQGTINALQNNLSVTQNNLLQMILEFHGNVTVLQTGNVSWTLSDIFASGPNPACATPSQYVNQGSGGVGSLIPGTYVLQNVQVASLNYTMLVLNPPSQPLTYTYPSDVGSVINLCVLGFTPTIDFFDSITDSAPGVTVYQFTASNLARITATPNCLADGSCFIAPYLQEWYTGTGAYSLYASTSFPEAGQFFLQWIYELSTGGFSLGTNYTISEPLQLILPSS